MNYSKSDALRDRAHNLIPGGAHTYAKGDDQYPLASPGFIVRGEGCRVWDADGNVFIEYGMGLRTVSLGHGHPRVVAAAWEQMRLGTNFGRPSVIELEAAEELQAMVGGEMIKFAKNGSDATSAAVKLARAFTGRDKVAVCADHPFFCTEDWFIGSTPMHAGIPKSVRDLTLTFRFNDALGLEALFQRHPGEIACLIMEAATATEPAEGYLLEVQRLCRAHGVVFILDEMITGFRWHTGGAQRHYGLQPDLSTFGKALANGFSVAALVGRRDIMERGGLRHGQERVFLLSTTHGAETSGLAAARATMAVYREEDVIGHMARMGKRLKDGADLLIAEAGVQGHFAVLGHPANLVFATRDADRQPSQSFRALFMQETLKRGLMLPSFVVSYAHGESEIDATLDALREVLPIYRKALDEGVEKYLVGRPVKPVFRAFN